MGVGAGVLFSQHHIELHQCCAVPSPLSCACVTVVRVFPTTFADCAVCDDGFTPAFNFRCKECPERESLSTAILAGVVVFVFLASGVVLSYLRRVPDDGEESEKVDIFQTPWRRTLTSLHNALEKGWPSSALKIIVVVWQIISQVHGRFLTLEVPLRFVLEDINQIPIASQAHERPDFPVQNTEVG